ncbi:MAG: SIMPL domain-containing protein [Rhodobacteraceae bacterium]|nr:SIMPL domain-containing protein [Paracoccaceae bacterium]
MSMNWGVAVCGLFLGLGLAVAGLSVGEGVGDMRRSERLVTVKGLAERDVEASLATWRIPFRGVGDDAAAAFAQAEKGRVAVRKFAMDGGLQEDELSNEPYALRVERNYIQKNNESEEVTRYLVIGALRMRSENIDAIANLSGKTETLLNAGVFLGEDDYAQASQPTFIFNGLNDIKPELIRDATQNARSAAEQFANDSGGEVGGIASANQGVIQIVARDSGFDERLERLKTVRVVTTVRYYLEN